MRGNEAVNVPSTIKAVSFDVDGTLQDFDGMMRYALRKVLTELSQLEPEAARALDVERMMAIRDDVQERLRGRVNNLNAIREESIRQALREAGRPDDELGSHLAQVYFRSRDAARTLFSDVRPALERLAASYRLGLLSNGNSYADNLGLGDLISFEVFSQDHDGMEKPDPCIFEVAFREAGCRPHELLHVGDSLESDVAGAKASGSKAVWLNRGSDPLDGHHEPDFEIRSLLELDGILGKRLDACHEVMHSSDV